MFNPSHTSVTFLILIFSIMHFISLNLKVSWPFKICSDCMLLDCVCCSIMAPATCKLDLQYLWFVCIHGSAAPSALRSICCWLVWVTLEGLVSGATAIGYCYRCMIIVDCWQIFFPGLRLSRHRGKSLDRNRFAHDEFCGKNRFGSKFNCACPNRHRPFVTSAREITPNHKVRYLCWFFYRFDNWVNRSL